MAIKLGKERIIITLPENQVKWLESMAKRAKKTKSQFISIFLARKADELYNFLKYEENKPSPEDLDEMMKIIKEVKWLDD